MADLDPDRERLLAEIGKLFVFVQNENGLATKEDCQKIMRSFKFDLDVERCEKELLSINDLAEHCKLDVDMKKKEEQLLHALQAFEDPEQVGMLNVHQLRGFLELYMSPNDVENLLGKKGQTFIDLDLVLSRLLKF